MPRCQRYGETTCSPISKSECIHCGRPPASISRVRPRGVTSKMESPCPTSIVVISITPRRMCACAGTNEIQHATAPTRASDATTAMRDRRAASIANAKAAAAARIVANEGIATRKSAIDAPTVCAPPSQCTVPVIPCNASPEIHTAGFASVSRNIANSDGSRGSGHQELSERNHK